MFVTQLAQRATSQHTRLCIGLDPHIDFIRDRLSYDSVLAFNRAVIDATADLALCYKPQIAHYSAYGLEKELQQTIDYIHQKDPSLTVILDAKRGDIGSTAQYYAREVFDRYAADAVTVNPYLGFDSVAPFLAYQDRGVIVLIRTSNPSGDDVQCQLVNDKPLYFSLAEQLDRQAEGSEQLLFVMGAADIVALRAVRERFPQRWLLVPGIGAQGGDLPAVLQAGGANLIVNVGRAILYPEWDGQQDYMALVRQAAVQWRDNINQPS